MRRFWLLTLLVAFLLPLPALAETPVAESYAGGDGSEGNPYQIATLGQLRRLSETPDDWNKHFIQIADIDASDTATWNYDDYYDFYNRFGQRPK
ncbi:MAG: hypothetical protein EOM23_00245 [Candidatus Moranbacteria bacterium]|nr:hypothetical protein [Candidatus Moranbacteria bacterium]